MASFTFNPLQLTQLHHLSSCFHCNYSSSINTSKFYLSFDPLSVSPAKHKLKIQVKLRVAARSETTTSVDKAEELSTNGGFSSSTDISKRAGRISLERNHIDKEEPVERRVILKDRHSKIGLNSKSRKEVRSGVSSKRFKGKKLVKSTNSDSTLKVFDEDADKKNNNKKKTKKPKDNSPGHTLRIGLDMCSKRGDVMGAIKLYDLAKKEGIKLGQYHYAVLLYLCSSAATGMVQPAKSGSRSRNLSPGDNSVVDSESVSYFDELVKRGCDRSNFYEQNQDVEPLVKLPQKIEFSVDGIEDSRNPNNESMEVCEQTLDYLVEYMKKKTILSNSDDENNRGCGIEVSKDVKRAALQKGFQIHNEMREENVPMNEATFTSVARMAMAFGDGDMAFDMVMQMQENGISPKLRSYGPALAIFCSNGDIEKAFMVEKHMMENGVYPEEPELGALLKVSLEAGKSDKVYYVLHKLRTSVRQVSLGTADLIERWFKSKASSRIGKRKWDQEMIMRATEKGGGGWHGKGFLGRGKWSVSRSHVDSDGLCRSCGEKLVTIDLDAEETENFAKSVASIAAQREKKSSFQKFQKWLDYYGPFEAVVDAANVGLYAQRTFKPSKVNAVANGIRRMLPSKKWPLIVLHNRRISGEKMDEPLNRALIDKWRNADALYATPTGSNDDWYWLYAAIKCRCLLVTNDEMRDHLFQLLGNDFFPKWKERHQVHFSFDETGPIFRMPPPFSVVIQESEQGHWHIPIVSELENEDERIWLCCSRPNSSLAAKDSADVQKDSPQKNRETRIGAGTKYPVGGLGTQLDGEGNRKEELQKLSKNVKNILFSSGLENGASIAPKLEAAEEYGDCLIDFQI